jgi:pyroglutamyl-peptidase
MSKTILMTSFRPWLSHHRSNSADDLLALIQKQPDRIVTGSQGQLVYLRGLPVDTNLASQQTIASIQSHQPDAIICCGMAESRTGLTIESQAFCNDLCLQTTVKIDDLLRRTKSVEVSHDAGKFVCEGLYFNVLNHLNSRNLSTPCIFVHVPLIDDRNRDLLVEDFSQIAIGCFNAL